MLTTRRPAHAPSLFLFLFLFLQVWLKCENMEKGTFDSSAKKNFSGEELGAWAAACGATSGDLVCIFAGTPHEAPYFVYCLHELKHVAA